MKLIEVTHDTNGNNDVGETTKFDPILAGEKSEKKIYIKNVINYPVDVTISIEGEDVEAIHDIKRITPGETKEVILVFTPKVTKLKPINVNMKIHAMTLAE